MCRYVSITWFQWGVTLSNKWPFGFGVPCTRVDNLNLKQRINTELWTWNPAWLVGKPQNHFQGANIFKAQLVWPKRTPFRYSSGHNWSWWTFPAAGDSLAAKPHQKISDSEHLVSKQSINHFFLSVKINATKFQASSIVFPFFVSKIKYQKPVLSHPGLTCLSSSCPMTLKQPGKWMLHARYIGYHRIIGI